MRGACRATLTPARRIALACVLPLVAWSTRGYALDKHACVAASDRGQALRLDGKLVEARQELGTCADPGCPAIVQRACADWLTDLDKTLPSVVVSVRDEGGRDVMGAEVLLDGQPLESAMGGRAIFVDPGPHTLRFSSAGMIPIEQPVVIREGEQRRPIDVILAKALPATQPAPAAALASRGTAAPWGFAVAAAVAWTAFGVLAIDGHVQYEGLKDSCAPGCSSDAYGPINVKFDVADVSLGLAIALTGVSTVLFLTGHPDASARVAGPVRVGFAF